jgi:lipopolysaccharide heptosyltransferase I
VKGPVQGRRFLVVRLGAIGDVLRVLPAVRRLRRSMTDIHIGWAVDSRSYPIVAGNPNVNRFHVVDRRAMNAGTIPALRETRRVLRQIRAEKYDVVLDFHGRLKSGLVSRLSRVRQRIGFARAAASEGNHLFNNVHVQLGDNWENRVLRFLHLLGPLGIDTSYAPGDHGLYVDPEVRRAAVAWYDSVGRPAVAAYPGTSLHRARERWPERKWADLLRRLGRERISSVVFWGPDEEDLAAAITDAAGRNCQLAPATTLPELMAMIGCFKTYVGSDTAAMHMAWLQGVPTAAFIGPKPPRTASPLAPVPSYVLRAEEYFEPGLRPSRQPDELITAVPVGEALEAIEQLLAANRARTFQRSSKGA